MSSDDLLHSMVRGLRDVIILHFLSEGPLHGYEINKRIKENFKVEYPSSIIYPVLRELEEKGLLASEWSAEGKRKKRVYYITDKGRTALREARTAMESQGKVCIKRILGV